MYHSPKYVQHSNAVSSPFISRPIQRQHTINDIVGSALEISLDGTTASVSSCVSATSDTMTFYSTVEVKSVPLQDDTSSALSMAIPGRQSTITATIDSRNDSADEKRILQRHLPPTDADSMDKRRHSPQSKKSISCESTSDRGHRSVSSSTTGHSAKASRRSSVQLLSHAAAYSFSSQSNPHHNHLTMSRKKREDLLALHRDCCQIFQGYRFGLGESQTSNGDRTQAPQNAQSTPLSTSEAYRSSQSSWGLQRPIDQPSPPITQGGSSASSEAVSPVMSPAMRPRQYALHVPTNFDLDQKCGDLDPELVHHNNVPQISNHQSEVDQQYQSMAATVIDWTSPATRKREYEKIDRSTRGIRGLWRKLAPKCIQPAGGMTPFFEEGKDGKGNYEGSVRRFRMDIPDEIDDGTAGHYAEVHDKRTAICEGKADEYSPRAKQQISRSAGESTNSTSTPGTWSCLHFRTRSRRS
jgi:hypothetical protein